MFKDADGHVRTIIAPSVTYNEIRGITGTFRYFFYASDVERLELVTSYSQKIDRELDLHYRNFAVFGGRFHTDLQLLHERTSSVRFFGIGPSSQEADESNMTLEVSGIYAIFGLNITPTLRLSLGETLQRFNVEPGGVPGLPFTGDLFPDLPGIDGATIHAQRVALIHDSRDSQTTPTRGLYASAFAEASTELLGSDADYIKAGGEGIYLKPYLDRRLVVVVRALFEALSGPASTPFEVLPTLGGAVFSAPPSEPPPRCSPFVDVGKVFDSWEQLFHSRFEVTPGIGFRGLAPPSVVGHIEFAYSREGPAIYVGLDYPF